MSQINQLFKRIFDLLVLILLFPLFIVIFIVIFILAFCFTGPKVIFSQERAGKNMKPFILYKFRTMKLNCDPYGPSPKDGVDPRLTKIGRFLRWTSLDELPQFFNVLKGDMSLVGPRPLYMSQAQEWNEHQRQRLNVKPGITGLAQISGRGSLTIEEKIELDVKYALTQSLWQDAKILFLTIFTLFRPSDIYEKRYSKTEETRNHSDGSKE